MSDYIKKIKDLEVSRYEQELLHQKLNNELYQAKNNLSKLSAIKY